MEQISTLEDIIEKVNTAMIAVIGFYSSEQGFAQQISNMMKLLSEDYAGKLTYFYCIFSNKHEEEDEIRKKYVIKTLPTIIVFRNGVQVNKLDTCNAPALCSLVEKLCTLPVPEEQTKLTLMAMEEISPSHLSDYVNSHDVVMIMKGTKDQPYCRFSKQAVEIFKKLNVDFNDINILENSQLRSAFKEFSNWPTFPQIYIAGEFIGGVDILSEMYANGTLQPLVERFRKPSASN
jgi:monothiol glutaredoxin